MKSKFVINNVHKSDFSQSPFELEQENMINLFIKNGANINAGDVRRQTALHYASERGNLFRYKIPVNVKHKVI